MATLREIKSRIQAVENTKKITKTMEMISAAKAKKAIDKVHAAQPYANKINELIRSISSLNLDVTHPLLRKPESVKKVAILVVAANRGLCGGYNNNVIKMALRKVREYEQSGTATEVYLVGKKAVNVFKYQKREYAQAYTHIEDRPTYADAAQFTDELIDKFQSGKLDAVDIIYTRYISASRQTASEQRVLPLVLEKQAGEGTGNMAALFEPDAGKILQALVPKAVKTIFFQAVLDSVAGEQIARRIAMKNATDAATDMIKAQTRLYNRARQAKITQEISEIVAGADSVK